MKNLKQKLADKELMVGTFVKTPSMMVAEVLSQTELDLVCIDAEHSPFDRRDLDACIFAYRAGEMDNVVRIANDSDSEILNALDCGATGIVVPHVDSADKARRVVKASKYGAGGRGYAGSTRAAGYASKSVLENLEYNRNETVVIAQIEDLDAFNELDDIAATDGIDCLFIGTMDLTVALGKTSAADPLVEQHAIKVCEVAKRHNKAVGIFVPSVDDVEKWQARGVSLFLMGSDHGFIKQGANALCAKIKV